MTTGPLAVWLYGYRVGLIDQVRGRLRLAYTQEAFDSYPLGTPLLSLRLPLAAGGYPHGVVRPFLDGLLPEGEARRALAADFDLLASDTFGLIRALGRDCAGALVIQPDEEPAPAPATTTAAYPLAIAEVEDLVANLRSRPLGAWSAVRVSLAGVQDKLLLTRMADGSWGRPTSGAPSTHIVKPRIAGFANTVENEAFCMRLAKHLGLAVANVETMNLSGQQVIVVERYDRTVAQNGEVERIHQEDLCQANGIPPERKCEEDGGPSLRQIARILAAVASRDSLDHLLRAVTLNVVLGNGDAHGKNFSLLHHRSGMVSLAPLYDLMSTIGYGDTNLAMCIDQVRKTDRATGKRIVNEAAGWGVPRQRAVEIVTGILSHLAEAVERAREETHGLGARSPTSRLRRAAWSKQVSQAYVPRDSFLPLGPPRP